MKILIGKNTVGKTHELQQKYKLSRGNSILIDHNGTCERSNIYVDFKELQYESDRRNQRTEEPRDIEPIKSQLHEFYKAAKKSYDSVNATRNKSNGILKLERILESLLYQNLNNITQIYIDEPDTYIDSENLITLIQILNTLESAGVNIMIATHSSEFVNQCSLSILNLEILRGNYLMGTRKKYSISKVKIREVIESVYNEFNENDLVQGRRTGLSKIENAFTNPVYLDYIIMGLSRQEVVTALFYEDVYLFEGHSEKVINDIAYKNAKFSKIPCGGKPLVIIYAYIFEKLGVNITCVVDRDKESNCAHAKMNKLLDENFDTIFLETSLEEEFGIITKVQNDKVYNAFSHFSNDELVKDYKEKFNTR